MDRYIERQPVLTIPFSSPFEIRAYQTNTYIRFAAPRYESENTIESSSQSMSGATPAHMPFDVYGEKESVRTDDDGSR